MKAIIWIAATALAISLIALLAALWRWNTCGYDCGIFGIGSGPTATALALYSIRGLLVSSAVLIGTLLARRQPNR